MWFYVILFFIIHPSLSQIIPDVDNRLTYVRQHYGVNFELVDKIITDGGSTFYSHTWLIPWPTVFHISLPRFNCSSAMKWQKRCLTINRLINIRNHDSFSRHLHLINLLSKATTLVPLNNNNFTIRRVKRDTDNNTQRLNLAVPDWLGSDKYDKTSDYIMDALPSHTVGRFFSSLTGTPSKKDVYKLKDKLRFVGKAIYTNREAILQFEQDISSLSSVTNSRIDNLRDGSKIIYNRLRDTIHEMNNTYEKIQSELRDLSLRLSLITEINNQFIREILPVLLESNLMMMNISECIFDWIEGVKILTSGYLAPQIIPENYVKDLLQHIISLISNNAQYRAFKLLSSDPAYIYSLQNIIYSKILVPMLKNKNNGRNEKQLYLVVSIKVPLFRSEGILPLYRIDTYPVPTHAGLVKSSSVENKGITYIHNLADYIAVSENLEIFLLMDKKAYFSCKGKQGLKYCDLGTPNIKFTRTRNSRPCEYLLFIDEQEEIEKNCHIGFSKLKDLPLVGSAVQIKSDSTYLMHASYGSDMHFKEKWTLSCPQSKTNPSRNIRVCEMCRLKIPCQCSLSAKNFFLPQSFTHCLPQSSQEVSYINTVNLPFVKQLFDQEEMAQSNIYKKLQSKFFSHIKIKPINFTIPDNFSSSVVIANKYNADLIKMFSNIKKKLPIFKTKVDYALNKTRDMTDVVAYRQGDLMKAFHELFQGIIGSKLSTIISVIFSPFGLLMIAFILSAFEFIPSFTLDVHNYIRHHNNKKNTVLMTEMS